jgi:intein-like protein with splicing domain/LAGLIDADG DNA endonuclease family protein
MTQPIDIGSTFSPRSYQLPIWEAMKKYKRLILIMPRRSGKDVLCFNILYREALRKVGSYYYVFPTFSSGRRILWDQITMDGKRILDYIPHELIESKNEAMMRIKLVNGSYIQVIGSDNFDNTLVGTNPRGIIFSEYALQNSEGYAYSLPILRANDGFALFQSTPRGRNHFFDLWKIAQANPDVWFSYKLTVEDTKHVDVTQIRADVERGEISEDLVQQEYYCFPAGQNVMTASDMKSIEDIKINDLVISHTGRNRKVLGIISRDYEGDLIEISSFGSSENILCTPNHPVRVYNSSLQSYEWKNAEDITLQDRLVFPKKTLGNISIISFDLCMLIAWYITEGSCFNNGVQWTVKHEEVDRITLYLHAIGKKWNIIDNGSCVNIVVNSIQLVDFFKISCGLKANNKRIPFHLISAYEREFFDELMRGDGCLSVNKNYKKYSYTTVSRTLAYQVQLLANSLNEGYAAGISKRKSYEGEILKRKVNCLESYQVNIPFIGLKPIESWLIRAKNCIAARVKSINRILYIGKVYNLKVQYDESYIINGRAVHNCSFDQGISGSFYQAQLDRMRLNFQIGQAPWEPSLRVHTAWDLGVRDSTAIIFFQNYGSTIRLIDCYEKSSQGLDHYVTLINSKPYIYGVHLAPHDIGVKEFGTGMTRIEIAKKMGLNFTVVKNIALMDGIESVRSALAKVYIDEVRCKTLIKALENYRREYDSDKKVYKSTPLHDHYSHLADAMRYLCVGHSRTKDGTPPEEFDRLYKEAVYGTPVNMPKFFDDSTVGY